MNGRRIAFQQGARGSFGNEVLVTVPVAGPEWRRHLLLLLMLGFAAGDDLVLLRGSERMYGSEELKAHQDRGECHKQDSGRPTSQHKPPPGCSHMSTVSVKIYGNAASCLQG
jgi:hypothetical protein